MIVKSSNKTDVNQTELVLTIDAEEFEKFLELAYRRERKNISLPGFRKGKVPRRLCEKTFGEQVFFEDAINMLLNLQLPAMIIDQKLDIVDTPKVNVTSASKEEGVELNVVCVTRPVLEMTGYKGIEAYKPKAEVSEEDVDRQVEQLRQRNAKVVPVEDRAAENGDEVNFDFKGFIDGEAFEGGTGENYQLKLGSGQFIPGFEDQVVGHNPEEDFTVTVTFPEAYQAEQLAGKEATFECRIHSITREILPEMDDEFVKDVSEFDTVEELREDMRKKLLESAERAADNTFEANVVDKLIEMVDQPIPHVMFENRAGELMDNYARQLQAQGVNLETYLEYTGMTEDMLKETYLDRAEGEIKLRLALEAIASAEALEAGEEEIENSVQEIAARSNVTPELVKERIPMEDIKMDILVQKALELVKENAVATDTAPEAPADLSETEEIAAEAVAEAEEALAEPAETEAE